jgi:hypothetical protein
MPGNVGIFAGSVPKNGAAATKSSAFLVSARKPVDPPGPGPGFLSRPRPRVPVTAPAPGSCPGSARPHPLKLGNVEIFACSVPEIGSAATNFSTFVGGQCPETAPCRLLMPGNVEIFACSVPKNGAAATKSSAFLISVRKSGDPSGPGLGFCLDSARPRPPKLGNVEIFACSVPEIGSAATNFSTFVGRHCPGTAPRRLLMPGNVGIFACSVPKNRAAATKSSAFLVSARQSVDPSGPGFLSRPRPRVPASIPSGPALGSCPGSLRPLPRVPAPVPPGPRAAAPLTPAPYPSLLYLKAVEVIQRSAPGSEIESGFQRSGYVPLRVLRGAEHVHTGREPAGDRA